MTSSSPWVTVLPTCQSSPGRLPDSGGGLLGLYTCAPTNALLSCHCFQITVCYNIQIPAAIQHPDKASVPERCSCPHTSRHITQLPG